MLSIIISLGLNLITDPSTFEVDKMTVSWYGPGFHGRPTASGEPFDKNDPTMAAHKSLPFGTKIVLRNPETGGLQEVEVVDRGPFVKGRDLDVSEAAARKLGMTDIGVAKLQARVVYRPPPD